MPNMPPRNQGNVPIPEVPQAVPTLADITNARRYIERLTESKNLSKREPAATTEDITRAEIYKHGVTDQHYRAEQGNPDHNLIAEVMRNEIRRALDDHRRDLQQSMDDHRRNLQQSMEDHQRNLQQSMNDLRREIQQTMEDFRQEVRQSVVTATNPVLIMSTRAYNAGCGTDVEREYAVLPFLVEGELVRPDEVDAIFAYPQTKLTRREVDPPLPLLTTVQVINGLDDEALNRYLRQYDFRHYHNNRRPTKLRKQRDHLGVVKDE